MIHRVYLQSRRWLAHDVLGLWLQLPADSPFRYRPGQYIDLLLDDGRRRSFSIANAPDGGALELHVRVRPGGQFGRWAAQEMPEHAQLRFEGPLGGFHLRDDRRQPILLVGGGTGIAPLQAMLEDLLRRGDPRPLHLFWGVRTQRDLYLHERLQQWAQAHRQLHYLPVLSEPDPDWTGARGFVHEAVLHRLPSLRGFDAYLSGPPAMIEAGRSALVAAGLDPQRLFYDAFEHAFETWPSLG
ncbi:MAG: NAD(P)H-flavin reductase [Pseudomonadota bacterium]